MTKCKVNHPNLIGVKCDHKRGHDGWHRSKHLDPWLELEKMLFWQPGRGRKRATATWMSYVS